MPTRIIREGIIDSEAVNRLSLRGEVFYKRLISIVDDFGRFEARPQLLRGKLFTCQLDRWTEQDLEAALTECVNSVMSSGEPLIVVYSVGGKKYLQLNNFGQRTRAQKSKYPSPAVEVRTSDSGALTNDGHSLTDDGHLPALARLDGDGDGDGDGDEKTLSAAKIAAACDLASETFDATDEARAEACNSSPAAPRDDPPFPGPLRVLGDGTPKKSQLNPQLEAELDRVATRIHGRHPAIRRCGIGEVKTQVRAILRRFSAAERLQALKSLDQNHEAWCKTDDWRKDGGQYAKGLANWLAPSKGRWEESPPGDDDGADPEPLRLMM